MKFKLTSAIDLVERIAQHKFNEQRNETTLKKYLSYMTQKAKQLVQEAKMPFSAASLLLIELEDKILFIPTKKERDKIAYEFLRGVKNAHNNHKKTIEDGIRNAKSSGRDNGNEVSFPGKKRND